MFVKQEKLNMSGIHAIRVSLFFLIVMWLVYWAEFIFFIDFYQFGVLPGKLSGLKGVFLMPFIHSKNDPFHIINNSLPMLFLSMALFYFYRSIAWAVLLFGWISSGLLLWFFAEQNGSSHIGMSGIIYMLAFFLFFSGVFRKYKPLQAISLFIAFLYGSMVWGLFPLQVKVSWEGHLSGAFVGIILAVLYRKRGPQRPKYQYEIERELGIEPPDLEGIFEARLAELESQQQVEQPVVQYHFIPKVKSRPDEEKTG
jgi:membrane associated rhomboid family serine protease